MGLARRSQIQPAVAAQLQADPQVGRLPLSHHLLRTAKRRPGLLSRALDSGAVSDADRRWLEVELETNLSEL